MAVKKEARKVATLASKIAGKKKRWHRDIQGRFAFASVTKRSPGDFSKEGKKVVRKRRPTVRATRPKTSSRRIRLR